MATLVMNRFTPNKMIIAGFTAMIALFFLAFLILPLGTVFEHIFIVDPGFAGTSVWDRLASYFRQPSLLNSLKNSLSVAILVTVIRVCCTFIILTKYKHMLKPHYLYNYFSIYRNEWPDL